MIFAPRQYRETLAHLPETKTPSLIQKGIELFHAGVNATLQGAKGIAESIRSRKIIERESISTIDMSRRTFGKSALKALAGAAAISILPIITVHAEESTETEIHPEMSLDELKEYPVYKRLILLSDIPDEFLKKPEEELIAYIMEHPVRIEFDPFIQGKEFEQRLTLADIIPESIGALSVDSGLTGYRFTEKPSPIFTAGEFFNSFRGVDWCTLPEGRKRTLCQNKQDLRLEESKRLTFRNGSIIQCREILPQMVEEQRSVMVDEDSLEKESLDAEHKKLDSILLEKSGESYRFISLDTRPADILTLNLGLKRLLTHLIQEFPDIRISSGRRSQWNNSQNKGAQRSKHLAGAGIDIVGNTPDKKRNIQIIENVEAFLMSHGFSKYLSLLCHGGNYHLHMHDISSEESSGYQKLREKHGKNLDIRPDAKNPFKKTAAGNSRLSESDKHMLERYDYDPEIAACFLPQTCNPTLKKRLLKKDIRMLVQEA